mmetsp:Transcript_977/g.2382  ORF Transcript_977/g.2382 Transcript_977/m.2382 type:complete len:291 (+) Transcript_977:31-903(+)
MSVLRSLGRAAREIGAAARFPDRVARSGGCIASPLPTPLVRRTPALGCIQVMGMAGHSKWHNIKHRKGAEDAKRAAVYARIGKQLRAAMDQGGNTPNNTHLKNVLDHARELKVPKDITDRAIARAMQAAAGGLATYEGMGPAGISVMVQCVTDNKQRTAPKLRAIFAKRGLTLGTSNSVAFKYRRAGRIEVAAVAVDKAEFVMEKAIELGAEDVDEVGEDGWVITCAPEDLTAISGGLKDAGIEVSSEELIQMPLELVEVAEDKMEAVATFLEDLEGYEETDAVYHDAAE